MHHIINYSVSPPTWKHIILLKSSLRSRVGSQTLVFLLSPMTLNNRSMVKVDATYVCFQFYQVLKLPSLPILSGQAKCFQINYNLEFNMVDC